MAFEPIVVPPIEHIDRDCDGRYSWLSQTRYREMMPLVPIAVPVWFWRVVALLDGYGGGEGAAELPD